MEEVKINVENANENVIEAIEVKELTLKQKICFRVTEIILFMVVEFIFFVCVFLMINFEGFVELTSAEYRSLILHLYKATMTFGFYIKIHIIVMDLFDKIKAMLAFIWCTIAGTMFILLMSPPVVSIVISIVTATYSFVTTQLAVSMWTLKPVN